MELLGRIIKRVWSYFVWYHVYLRMKSGAMLYMGTCKELNYKYNSSAITSIELVRRRPGSHTVLIQSVMLDQIEAISIRKTLRPF